MFIKEEETAYEKNLSGLKTLFLVHFVIGLIFGLGYMLFPATMMGWVGMTLPDVFPWQLVGAAILAFTISSWYCYKETDWDKVKIVVLAEIGWTVLVSLVGLYGLLFAGQPSGLWINVILMAGFAVAFAYFYSKH